MRIKKSLEAVNTAFAADLVVPFSITIGDEWQGVLKDLAASYEAMLAFEEALEGVSFSCGVGKGKIATPIAARSSEMDGEAFHRSRLAVEQAKREDCHVVFSTGDGVADELINALAWAMWLARKRWTSRQLQKIALFRQFGDVERVARKLRVSRSDVNQALSATDARFFLKIEQALLHHLGS